MTGIVDITAVALYMHYWGAFGGVPQWVFALGALTIVGTMNMIGVKWFAEMEFWFALIKVLPLSVAQCIYRRFHYCGGCWARNGLYQHWSRTFS